MSIQGYQGTGCQAGICSTAGLFVRLVCMFPAVFITKISLEPSLPEVKAIHCPSPENAGSVSLPVG